MSRQATVEVLTDAELCDRLRISETTLRRHLREGPPRGLRGAAAGDVRLIRHVYVGGARRWVRSSVDEFIHGEA